MAEHGDREPRRNVQAWRNATPEQAIDRITQRSCDTFAAGETCISRNAPDHMVCDPCRLVAVGAHDIDWSLLNG